MTAQRGRELLVRIGDGQASEAFNNLCGLNSKTLTINNSPIDVTRPDCTNPGGPLWAQSLDGLKAIAVAGDGFFEDSAQEARINAVAMAADNSANFEIVVPSFGTYAGAFRVDSLEFGGETQGGVSYSLALSSNGPVTFTAA